jgi:hypothetical protein
VESLAAGDIYLMIPAEYGMDLEPGWQNIAEWKGKKKNLSNLIPKTINVCHI